MLDTGNKQYGHIYFSFGPQIKSFVKLSTFVDLSHYLYYKIRERKTRCATKSFTQPNLREGIA
jgi:hypothetical protein